MNNLKKISIGKNTLKIFKKHFSLIAIGTLILASVGVPFFPYSH